MTNVTVYTTAKVLVVSRIEMRNVHTINSVIPSGICLRFNYIESQNISALFHICFVSSEDYLAYIVMKHTSIFNSYWKEMSQFKVYTERDREREGEMLSNVVKLTNV